MMKKYSSRKKHCCTFLQPSIPLAHENDLLTVEEVNSDAESYFSNVQKDIFSEGLLINENTIEKTLVKLADIMPQSLSICNELLENHSNKESSSAVCTSDATNCQCNSEKNVDGLPNLFDKLEVERKRRCKMTMTFKNNSLNKEEDAGDFRSDSVLHNSDYRRQCSSGMYLHKKLSRSNKNVPNIEQFWKIKKPYTNRSNFCNDEHDVLESKLKSYNNALVHEILDNESESENKTGMLYERGKSDEANTNIHDNAVSECNINNLSNSSSPEEFVSIFRKVSTEKETGNDTDTMYPTPEKYKTSSLTSDNDEKSEIAENTLDSFQNSSYLENISLISELEETVNRNYYNEYLYSIKTYDRYDLKNVDKTKVKANINSLYLHDTLADINYNNINRNSMQISECNDIDMLPLSTIVEKLLTILTQSESRKSYSIIGNFQYEKTYIISLVSRFINNFVSFLQAKEKYESTKSSNSRNVLKKYIEEFKNTIKELENVQTIPNSPPTPGILFEENCPPENVKPLTSLIKEKSSVFNKFMSFEKPPRTNCKIIDGPCFVHMNENIKNPIFIWQNNRQDKLNADNTSDCNNMNENISFKEQNSLPDRASNNGNIIVPNNNLNYEYQIARGDGDKDCSDKMQEVPSVHRSQNYNQKNPEWNSNYNNMEINYYNYKNYENNEPPYLVQENNSTITHNCFLYLKERINYNTSNEASTDPQYQCHHCNYDEQCCRNCSQNIYLQEKKRKSFRNCKSNWQFRKHKKYVTDHHSKYIKCIQSYSTQKRHSFSCDTINCNCRFDLLQENESDNNNNIRRNNSQLRKETIYLPQRANSSKCFVNSNHYMPQYLFENHKCYSNKNFMSKSKRHQILENNCASIHYNSIQDSHLNNQLYDYMAPGQYEIPQKIEQKFELKELSFILQILEKLYSEIISKDQEQLFDKILCTTNSIMQSEKKKKLIQHPSMEKENKTKQIWKSAIEALIMLQTQLKNSSKFTLNNEDKLEGLHRENFSHKSKNCVSAGEWIKQTIENFCHNNTAENQHLTH